MQAAIFFLIFSGPFIILNLLLKDEQTQKVWEWMLRVSRAGLIAVIIWLIVFVLPAMPSMQEKPDGNQADKIIGVFVAAAMVWFITLILYEEKEEPTFCS